jgi:signal transduction histidine kinase
MCSWRGCGPWRGAEGIDLTRTEFSLLEFLMRRHGSVVTRKALIEGVWGHDRDIDDNTLDAPEQSVFVDGEQAALGRLVVILADNAAKYTPAPGEVCVTLRTVDGMAEIEVADPGIGVSAEDLPRVFERFYRADKARSRESGGAGLGLSIARWIVERHGGCITIESEAGKGCLVRVPRPLA